MALLKELEKNVEVVVEILEDWSEVIEQQFIFKDLSISQIEDVIVKTSLGMGLKEKALNDVSVAMYFGSALWKNSFNEILMWLNRYMPQFKSQIERKYSNIVNHLNAILSAQHDLQGFELCGLKDEIGRLAHDLRYCAKMAREEWEDGKDGENSGGKVRNTKKATETENIEQQEKDGQSENWHNDDFTEVLWNGKKYKFNKPQQVLSVEYLWKNKRAREKSIGEAIGSEADNFRLIHIFRQRSTKTKMHPAWGTMIVPDGKGIYALAECKKAPKK